MSKRYAFFLSILLCSCNVAKPVIVEISEPVVFMFEDLDLSQDELFLKANEWMISTFNNAESVIQYSDKEAGTLMGKYILYERAATYLSDNITTPDTRVYATLDIRVKDNKARLAVKVLDSWTYSYVKFSSGKEYISGVPKEDALNKIESLSASFKKNLLAKGVDF
jgi:hypothetical protein